MFWMFYFFIFFYFILKRRRRRRQQCLISFIFTKKKIIFLSFWNDNGIFRICFQFLYFTFLQMHFVHRFSKEKKNEINKINVRCWEDLKIKIHILLVFFEYVYILEYYCIFYDFLYILMRTFFFCLLIWWFFLV